MFTLSVSTPARKADNSPKVGWWSSIALIRKRKAPEVAGVAVLYSEELDLIFHAFETDNLLESLHSFSRVQSIALGQDPNCRVCWKETTNPSESAYVFTQLRLMQQLQPSCLPIDHELVRYG